MGAGALEDRRSTCKLHLRPACPAGLSGGRASRLPNKSRAGGIRASRLAERMRTAPEQANKMRIRSSGAAGGPFSFKYAPTLIVGSHPAGAQAVAAERNAWICFIMRNRPARHPCKRASAGRPNGTPLRTVELVLVCESSRRFDQAPGRCRRLRAATGRAQNGSAPGRLDRQGGRSGSRLRPIELDKGRQLAPFVGCQLACPPAWFHGTAFGGRARLWRPQMSHLRASLTVASN